MRHRRRKPAFAAGGVVLAAVLTVPLVAPSGAFGVSLTGGDSDTEATTSLDGGRTSLDDGLTGDEDADVDDALDAVTGTLGDLVDTVEGAAEELGDDSGSDDGTKEEDPVEDPKEEPADEETAVDGDTDDGTDEVATEPVEEPVAEEDAEEEPVFDARFVRAVDMTRHFGELPPPPIIGPATFFPVRITDYVDVPLGPRSTRGIVDLLEAHGASFEDLVAVLVPFPVAGPAGYSNDWGAPRHGPVPRPHVGTDIFAPRGTPIIASIDGVVGNIRKFTAIGGNSLRVTAPDGTYHYYAHLDGFAPAAVEGNQVTVGTVLGYVGDTGNAVGTPPHLHFQVHPGGGDPVPPLPYLDRWLEDARQKAAAFAGVSQGQAPPGGGGAPWAADTDPRVFQAAPFAPAASERESHVATAAFLLISALLVLAVRRRHDIAQLLPDRMPAWIPAWARRQRRPEPRRLSLLGQLRPFSLDQSLEETDRGAGRAAPRDVLAPLLGEGEHAPEQREHVGSRR